WIVAFHEPVFRPRRRSRSRPRLGALSSRTRTSRRTIWFMVPMHAENRKGALQKLRGCRRKHHGLLLCARSFLEPVEVSRRGGGKRAAYTSFDRRFDGPPRTGHDPTMRFRVAIGKGEAGRAIVIGGGQVAPSRFIESVHEKAVIDR